MPKKKGRTPKVPKKKSKKAISKKIVKDENSRLKVELAKLKKSCVTHNWIVSSKKISSPIRALKARKKTIFVDLIRAEQKDFPKRQRYSSNTKTVDTLHTKKLWAR